MKSVVIACLCMLMSTFHILDNTGIVGRDKNDDH